MSAAPIVKGWCPGAYAPMESGDGLLLRAKLIGPRLSLQQARAVAALAQSCGNGRIDLSQRAQLQLRGIRAATLDDALRGLDAAGLLAKTPLAERVQNVVAPPFLREDAPSPQALVAAIYDDPTLHDLPPKFLFLIDDSGSLGLADVDADIRLETTGSGRVALGLGGARDVAAIIEAGAAIDAARALARAFLESRIGAQSVLRRMRALVNEIGAAEVFARAGLTPGAYRSACSAAEPTHIFGAQRRDALVFSGVGAAFGRWRAEDLTALADGAERCGAQDLRVTPWRAILAQTPDVARARNLCDAMRERGLIVDGADPLLAVVACPGAPDCEQALGETHALARRLAPLARRLAPRGAALHVSGCAKGCAHPGPTPATLVAQSGGYDLIVNGAAGDAPHRLALAPQEIEQALLERAAREPSCPAH
jgi:precorrin-3B synthase